MSDDPLARLKAELQRAADGGAVQLRHILYRTVGSMTRTALGGKFLHELHERARAADAARGAGSRGRNVD